MIKTPKHLKSKSSREFFKKLNKEFEFEDHHIKILVLACECLDQIDIGLKKIEKEGEYYKDRFNNLRPHPALKEIKDNKIIFLRLIKQLGLNSYEGEVGRPPTYSSRRGVIRKKEIDKKFEKLLD